MKILSTITFLLLINCLGAQELISVTYQENISAASLSNQFDIQAEYDLAAYKVVYTSTDPFGAEVTLSGMLAIPIADEDLNFPLAVYNHGTAFSRESVPSRIGVFERSFVNVIATFGYITIAPDYVGLGDDPSPHPYVHAATEASAGRDMINAVKIWLEEQPISFNDQLFLTGYSQGGHASMALHRDIESNPGDDGLEVTAAAHLSGPYSISGVMKEIITENQAVTFPGYLAQTYISYNQVYQLYADPEQVFVSPYLTVVEQFIADQITSGEMNNQLDSLLILQAEGLRDIFQDSIIDILTNQPEHPVNLALEDNDLFDWVPQAPTLLVYCTEDEQVPFRNAIIADSVMNALGAPLVQSVTGGDTDHSGCVLPAAFFAINLFNGYADVTTSLAPAEVQILSASPNPIRIGEPLRLNTPLVSELTYQWFNAAGKLIESGIAPAGSTVLPQSHQQAGVYFLHGSSQGKTFTLRLLVHP